MNKLSSFLANSLSIFTTLPFGRGLGWAVALWLGVGLTSCTDHYDLDKLQNTSKLVFYCFPAADDTTYINVTASMGVKKFTDTRGIHGLDDAQVVYRVNGQERHVHQLSALLPISPATAWKSLSATPTTARPRLRLPCPMPCP